METTTILKQLEKALACKDDKELRFRVEVLVDMIKEIKPSFPQIPQAPQQPLITREPTLSPQPTVSTQPKKTKTPKINGAGAIVGGEQINYTRPKGT